MKESNYNIWVEDKEHSHVFNSMSGSLLSMTQDEFKGFKSFINKQSRIISPDLLENMARGYMIIPDETNELELLSKLYQNSRNDESRLSLTIVTSLGCNFDCPYCFEAKYPSVMDDEVQKCIAQLVDDQIVNKKIRNLNVSWFGGEPLVGKKALTSLSESLIQKCQKYDVTYFADITTNGYLLDEDTCKDLAKYKITRAQITLDGPPEIHDKMRPLTDGRGSFWKIIENLHLAIKYVSVDIRVNIDLQNFGSVEKLFEILSEEGLADQLSIHPGQIVGVDDGLDKQPSAAYKGRCFKRKEYAEAEIKFGELAKRYGFSSTIDMPSPLGAPCTAVRKNELVIGSKGELYKCWEVVGNPNEICGDIRDYNNLNGRLHKWLNYDPFANSECQTCIALPVCMGGCAHHAMSMKNYENRCDTFRYNYREKIIEFVKNTKPNGSTGIAQVEKKSDRMDTR
jgi:uncharacterized protein